jgi:intein/homing endonuclease
MSVEDKLDISKLNEKEKRDLLLSLRRLSGNKKTSQRKKVPTTDDELWQWVVDNTGFEIPRVAVCEDHTAPFDFMADYYFERERGILVLGARESSKTLGVAIINYAFCETKNELDACTFADIEAQSNKSYSYIKKFVYTKDDNGRKIIKGGIEGEPLRKETRWINGSKLEVLIGSLSGVNSPHPQKVHADEIDLMDEQVWLESRSMASSRKLPDGTIIKAQDIATSTRKSSKGLMQKLIDESEKAKKEGFKPPFRLYASCVFESAQEVPECRGAKKEDREKKLKELGKDPCELCDCVLPDTKIEIIGETLSAYRRPYRGPVIDFITASGKQLTVTPNHPVLTNRGWVLAHLLQKGDDVVCGPVSNTVETSDFNKMPTAEDIFAVLKIRSSMVDSSARSVSHSIAPLSVDFHGDGVFSDGKIELVNTKLNLPLISNRPIVEKNAKSILSIRIWPHYAKFSQSRSKSSVRYVQLISKGSAILPFNITIDDCARDLNFAKIMEFLTSTQKIMFNKMSLKSVNRNSNIFANITGFLASDVSMDSGIWDQVSFSRLMNSEFFKSNKQSSCGNSSRYFKRFSSLSVQISLNNIIGNDNTLSLSSGEDDSGVFESGSQSVLIDVDLSREVNEFLSGGVTLDEIVEVGDRFWVGHVYNFSTTGGAYSANGIITHNCNKVVKGEWAEGVPRTLESVCKGKFFRSRGWMPHEDVVGKFMQNSPTVWVAQLECRRPMADGLYLPTWSRERYCVYNYLPRPEYGLIWQSVDWGGSESSFVIWIQGPLHHSIEVNNTIGSTMIIPQGSYIAFNEISEAQMGATRLADKVVRQEIQYKNQFPGWRVKARFADMAGRQQREDWREHNPPLRTVWYISRDVEPQIECIQDLVTDHLLYVAVDKCPNLADDFESWRQKDGREIHDQSCLVGDTLVKTNKGDVPIKNISIGDKVYTRQGLRQVKWSGQTGVRELKRVDFSDGRSLVGTDNHPVWVEGRGWTRIALLRPSDIVNVCDDKSITHEKLSSIEGFLGTGIQNHPYGRKKLIITALSKGVGMPFIDNFMKIISDRSLRVTRFITKISITIIIQLIILNLLQKENTQGFIGWQMKEGRIRLSIKKRFLEVLKGLRILQRQKEQDLLVAKRHGHKNQFSKRVAISAKKNIQPRWKTPNFVLKSAKVLGIDTMEKFMTIRRKEFANSVKKSLRYGNIEQQKLVPIRVSKVSDVYEEKKNGLKSLRKNIVYDLTIEGDHEFYANGILVHNSHGPAASRYLLKNATTIVKRYKRDTQSADPVVVARDETSSSPLAVFGVSSGDGGFSSESWRRSLLGPYQGEQEREGWQVG